MQVLIIQTAFIGDVVLATALLEKLKKSLPEVCVDFLVRKGNESLLQCNPKVRKVHVWDKRQNKRRNLLRIIGAVREQRYDLVINLHRHYSSGLVTAMSRARETRGFKKNPLSFRYDMVYPHEIGDGTHEVQRNQNLIADLTDTAPARPALHLSDHALDRVSPYKSQPFLTIAPGSIWKTKRLPLGKWIEFIRKSQFWGNIYLLGSPKDEALCQKLADRSDSDRVQNLCGKLTLIESAALMKDAVMNYTNDSGPLHLASAVNAPVCAVFCSTVPDFGFGPLSDTSFIIEREEDLYCRPCGLHGLKRCPEEHFKCAKDISVESLLEVLKKVV